MEEMYTEEIHQIYDRIFKRIFSLSNLAIINMINGLFQTNHPTDSKVEYFNKEFVSRALIKRFADVFVSINGVPYHLEAQMTKDTSIVVRVFEYGFMSALENSSDAGMLRFPEPIVIYLDTATNIPEKSRITLDFGTQGSFIYEVQNLVYQEQKISDLNQKKLIVLIPFQILKIKGLLEQKKDAALSQNDIAYLQQLLQNDILGSIKANLQGGNITGEDAIQLRELTLQLYSHILAHNENLRRCTDMKPLLPGAMELPLDKFRIEIDELKEALAKSDEEKHQVEAENARLRQLVQEMQKKGN